jgi:hypothetical protein
VGPDADPWLWRVALAVRMAEVVQSGVGFAASSR